MRFIFVGGMDKAHAFKGINVLLEAVALLPEELDWHLVMVGDGSERSNYMRLAFELGLNEKVEFVGSPSAQDLPTYYQQADVHILPSTDRGEAWGIVTTEAAASGLPSIVSDLPGVRTVIEPGETGWLVKPGDAADLARVMQQVIEAGSDKIAFMGARALQRATEKYDASRLLDRLVAIYENRHHL